MKNINLALWANSSPNASLRPWVGSFFGIPAPEFTKPINEFIIELELHVLRKDLSTKIVVIRTENDGVGNDLEVANTSKIAKEDPEAIAYIVYTTFYKKDGSISSTRHTIPQMRTSKTSWKSLGLD